MTTLYLDVETRSPVNIKLGAYRYVEECELLVVAWAVDDEPVDVIDALAGDDTHRFCSDFETADRIVAHNANFDRLVLSRYNIVAPLEKWECTMARAYAHSLPGSLEALCTIYNMPDDIAKLRGGKRLIDLFCKPRRDGSWATSATHPKEWAEFLEYGRQDIPPLRKLDQVLPKWNWRREDREAWHRNQRINDHGFAIDKELTDAAIQTVADSKASLQTRTDEITGGGLSVSQRDAMLQFITAQCGVRLPDLQASTLERRVEDESLPDDIRELLRIRLLGSQTSTSKWTKLRQSANSDQRLRGTAQYCGAGRTGRDSGRIFQPLNLPRPPKEIKPHIQSGIDLVKLGLTDLAFDDPIGFCAAALRGAIVAPLGKHLYVADHNAIEGRYAAWFAGEQWKIDAYVADKDLYVETYARTWNVPASSVNESQRQEGKVIELACQYGGAGGALESMAATYGTDFSPTREQVYAELEVWRGHPEVDQQRLFESSNIESTRLRMKEDRKTKTYRAWRRANPQIVATWYELDEALRTILTCPNGHEIPVRRCVVRKQGAWVRIIQPSGRSLSYPNMRLNDDGELVFQGVNQYTRKWEEIRTWGSRVFENLIQAGSRDVLVNSMRAIEEGGFDIVLTVYDEVVAEHSQPDLLDDYLEHMTAQPAWAPGLPLKAAGFVTDRYRKD